MYGDNITRLSLVNKFIKENYSFYEKFNFWEIYKKLIMFKKSDH